MNNKLSKKLLIAMGSIFLGLGCLGIVLPMLPTTPFLLLAAACYSKSSERFYNKLLNNKLLGGYIKNYREGRGIPIRAKLTALLVMWLSVGYSILYMIDHLAVRILLAMIAATVTVYIISIRPSESKASIDSSELAYQADSIED